MRTTAVVTAALLVLLTGADFASASPRVCGKPGSRTVKSTQFVRVYSVRNRDGGRNLYGCLRSNDRRQLMTRSSDDDYVSSSSFGHVKVAGRFVAWEQVDTDISCKAACPPDYDATTEALFIRDLKTRRTKAVDGRVDGRLVLTGGGAIAWTQTGTGGAGVVDAFDGHGARTLDEGNVDLESLSLSGSTVAWTRDGVIESAALARRT